MNMRRFLAAMLAVVMLIAMVPAKAQAAEDDTTYEAGKLYLDKTATLEDDGTYTIEMEAFATGNVEITHEIIGKPLDVVLVIDQSGSVEKYGYLDGLKTALNTFIENLQENGAKYGKTHRVAVVGFSCSEWELTITHSTGNNNETNLPLADGSYAQLWTNTGIYQTDGTFTNYQQFEFTPITRSQLPTSASEYYTFYGSYTHPVNGGSSQNREFPLYFVDDTETWPGQTVKRSIYLYNGNWYYDFRTNNGLNSSLTRERVPNMDTRALYRINYDYNTETDKFNGGYLTDADYQNTLMNVTDGADGQGNINAALNKIINGLGASGATRTGTGMEMAYNILAKNELTEQDIADGRERVVIVFTDGVPGQGPFEIDEANIAMHYGGLIKSECKDSGNAATGEDAVEIYTIGLFDDKVFEVGADGDATKIAAAKKNADILMNGLSSNWPEADSMDDVSATEKEGYAPVNSWNVTGYTYDSYTTVNGYYALVNGVYEPIQVRRTTSWSGTTYNFRSANTQTTLPYNVARSGYIFNYTYTATPDNTYGIYTLSTVEDRTNGGEYYKQAADIDDLANMFPVLEKTDESTSMSSSFLTEGSILRDIMGTGFLLSGKTVITSMIQKGEWTSLDAEHKTGTIKWTDVTPMAELVVEDPKALSMPEITDPIQVYNTNPNPGGNFYQTASGEPNLAAPPTIDVTGFDYSTKYIAPNKDDGYKLMVKITGVEAQPGVIGYDVNQYTNHEQSGLWAPMNPNDRTRTLVEKFPMPNTTFTEALYVLDYAKPMEIPLSDLDLTNAESLGVDNPHSLAVVEGMNYFDPENPNTEIQTGYFKSARPGSEETVPEATLPGGGTAVIDRIVITRDCADVICLQGSATSLTVAASNTHGTEMRYQWYACTDAEGNGAEPIEGATSATYQIPTNNCDVYYYYCQISADEVDTVYSSVATVRVHKFMIARDCADMVGFVNEDVPLSVEIATVPAFNLSYQWYICDDAEGNGAVAIADATESVYHASTSENGIHYYFCEIKGKPTLGTSTGPALGEETLRSSVAAVTVRIQNGKVTLNDGKVTYHPLTTNWDGYDTFYVFGESELSTITDYSSNRNGNLWSRVKVLPANNVYYEDTFIQTEDSEGNPITVGIVYGGEWSYAEEGSNQENPESGEFNNGEDKPFGGVHGWEDYLVDDLGYSDGGATTSNAAGATATFTFTGTGVDIYSYTDMKQGAVMASIYAGNAATGKALYSVIMDNFSLSDAYYQIPTLSLHEKYVRDAAGKNVKDENGNNVLEELGFGTYTVKLTVVPKTDDADGDGTKTTRYTYTLDGIRIYNPIQNLEGDETVQRAYGEEELNASFVEVRDILLDANMVAEEGWLEDDAYGVVFLDQVPDFDGENDSGDGQTGIPTKDVIGQFKDYGPKNEVYLAKNQGITFVPVAGYRYYVGMKSPTGQEVTVHIIKKADNDELYDQYLTIDHTTDLYYEVTPDEGIVLIENTGEALLSVTKIKVTAPDGAPVETADFFVPTDAPTVLRMVRTLREEAAAEPEIPEDTEPTEPTGPEVDIENPTEPSEPEVPGEDNKNPYDDLWKLIGGIFDLIRGIIFG